jgi:type IV pilus assembly protein PilM
MSILGLDIGTHNVKLIELLKDKDRVTLLAAGSMPTPPKTVSSNLGVDQQALAYLIRELIKGTGAKSTDVNISLPEAQVFTRVIEMPALSTRELTSAIRWESEQYIPLPLDQVNMDFTILSDGKDTASGKMKILLVGAPKALTERYMQIMELAELVPVSAETEIIALSRALIRSAPAVPNVMICSFGGQTTDIAILRRGVLTFTRSIAAGGDALTRVLSESLDFTLLQAEAYKKTYGLEKNILEGKILAVVKPVMETIIGEMKRATEFFDETYKNEHIGVILLAGGNAKLPGLIPYIAEHTGIEVQQGNPWVGIRKDPRFAVLTAEGPLFAVAIGLALREG